MHRTPRALGGATGPAASGDAMRRVATPSRRTLHDAVARTSRCLRHASRIADDALRCDEPEHGALHLVGTIRDLRAELALLETAARKLSS